MDTECLPATLCLQTVVRLGALETFPLVKLVSRSNFSSSNCSPISNIKVLEIVWVLCFSSNTRCFFHETHYQVVGNLSHVREIERMLQGTLGLRVWCEKCGYKSGSGLAVHKRRCSCE